MPQMVFDICHGVTTIKHVNSTGVAKAVYWVNCLEPLFGKGLFQIFPSDSVNTMTRYSFPPLIDEKPALKRRAWGCAVFTDIELE